MCVMTRLICCFAIGKVRVWLDYNAAVHSQVICVSDGAGSHFKDKCQLFEYRELEYPIVKWMLSATGHGKNAYYGVGGLVKYPAALQNLRQPASLALQNVKDMIRVLAQHLRRVRIIYINESGLLEFRNQKKEEWEKVRPAPGLKSGNRCEIVQRGRLWK